MWWDKRKLSKESRAILEEKKFNNKFLFVAVANTMPTKMHLADLAKDTTQDTEHIRSIFEFADLAKTKTDGGLKFESKYYGDDDHGSVPLIAEYDALRSMFSWYNWKESNPYFDSTSRTPVTDILKAVTDHYAHYGYGTPPEAIVNLMAYRFMNNKMNEKALAFFDLNVKNYPESPNVYDSRGDYYLAQKDTAQAIQNYEKTLSIEKVSYTKEKLEKLKRK
jgi:hypothetical protein